MIFINTTYCVDKNCVAAFVGLLRDRFIPAALSAGMCRISLMRMREATERNLITGQPTVCYALQMHAADDAVMDKFNSDFGDAFEGYVARKFTSAVTAFRTVHDVVFQISGDGKDG